MSRFIRRDLTESRISAVLRRNAADARSRTKRLPGQMMGSSPRTEVIALVSPAYSTGRSRRDLRFVEVMNPVLGG
jgi:hypothetical protein